MTPTYRGPAAPRQSGFTLIEVLVALLVFSFGILGVIGMQARSTQIATQATDRSRAALLANEIITQMWTQRSADLSNERITAWQTRVASAGRPGSLPNGTGTVAVNRDSTTQIATVTVTVAWRPPALAANSPANQFVTKVVMP